MEEAEPSRSGAPARSTVLAVALGAAILVTGLILSRTEQLIIIVVSMDTTRADHLSAYGYDKDTSPTLARLAAEGTSFTHARSTTSWTLPSHMSLFTGLPVAVHGVSIDFQQLDLGRLTLGKAFQDAGFRTVGLYTAPYVHPKFGFGSGMDFYEGMTANPMAYDLTPAEMGTQMGLREMYSHQEVTSPRVADRARFFLKERSSDRLLLFLHLFDPHYDYKAPPKFLKRFASGTYSGPLVGDGIMTQLELIKPDMDPADLAQLKAMYDAEIAFTDKHLGDVIAEVEAQGLVGRTIVVVTADHGEEILEAGRFGHRMTLRDEVLRVPLVFWGPGIVPAGVTVGDDVALYDVFPTLLELAGIERDPLLYGRSLRPLMDGARLPPRPSSAELTFLHRDGPDYYTRHDAVVFEGLKVVRRVRVPWSPKNDRDLSQEPLWETAEFDVYDLRADPGETINLYATEPESPRVLAVLDALVREQSAQDEARAAYVPRGVKRLANDPMADLDVMDQLRAVGYLTGQSGDDQ